MTHPFAGQWQFEVGGLMTASQAQDTHQKNPSQLNDPFDRQYISGARLAGTAINEVRGFFPLAAIINLAIDDQLAISGLLFNNRSGAAAVATSVTGNIRLDEIFDPIHYGAMTLIIGGGGRQDYAINLVSTDLIHLIMLRNTRIQGNSPFWMVLGGGRMRRVKLPV